MNPPLSKKIEEPEEPKTLLEQVSDALKTHQITCTKKAVAKQFRLSAEEVDKVFEELAELGLVGKKSQPPLPLDSSSRSRLMV